MIVREFFTTLASIPGSNDKMQFLNENTNEIVSLIFQDTYDTKRKYYVKKFNVTNTGTLTIDASYNLFHNLLEDLNNRVITGNAAVEAVERMIGSFVKEDQDLLCKILNSYYASLFGQFISYCFFSHFFPCCFSNDNLYLF